MRPRRTPGAHCVDSPVVRTTGPRIGLRRPAGRRDAVVAGGPGELGPTTAPPPHHPARARGPPRRDHRRAGPRPAVAGLREAGRPPRRHRAVHRGRRDDRRWTDRLVALPADRSGRAHQPAHPRCADLAGRRRVGRVRRPRRAAGAGGGRGPAADRCLPLGLRRLPDEPAGGVGLHRGGGAADRLLPDPGAARGAHRRDEPGARGPRGRQRPGRLEPDRDRDRRRDGGAGPRSAGGSARCSPAPSSARPPPCC